MVQLMVEGLGGDCRQRPPGEPLPTDIECYHVNCRYSEGFEDIGSFRLGKMWLVIRYCLEAIWCRYRYDVHTFYYVPAPGKRAALYRDWVVMLLCRPFFHNIVHHWHAVGLGDWLRSDGTWIERWVTHRLLGRGAVGIAVAVPSMRDALWFRSQTAEIVPNGIPDPCPDFDEDLLPYRRARVEARAKLLRGQTLTAEESAAAGGEPEVFQVLYLAHCTRAKGLFDALEGIATANARLIREASPLHCRLVVAGAFLDAREEKEFQYRVCQPDLVDCVSYAGFVEAEKKHSLFFYSDCFCFPSYHESFGLVVAEAMAYGLPAIATSIPALEGILPPDYPGLVPAHAPQSIAQKLVEFLSIDLSRGLRDYFVSHYTQAQFLAALRTALKKAAGYTA